MEGTSVRVGWKIAAPLGLACVAIACAGIVAFACTSLASLNLSQATGAAGSQTTVTGSSFNPSAKPDADGLFTPVTLHWNSVSGPVLADGIVPDPTGAIGPIAVTIPSSANPGYYMIVATQEQIQGGSGEAYGTPARTVFQVTGTAGATAPQPANNSIPATVTNSTSSGVGAGLIALLVVLGIAGIALFAMGTATYLGSTRRAAAAAKARKP